MELVNNAALADGRLVTSDSTRRRVPAGTALLMIGALLAGLGTGVAAEKYHHAHHAQDVIAAVNGVTIRQPEFYQRLQQTVGPAVIRTMVRDDLLLRFAARQKALPTEGQVNELFTEDSHRPGFQAALSASRGIAGDYRQQLRLKLAEANLLTQGLTIPDAIVRQFYQANINPKNPGALFYTPERMTADLIVTRTEEQASQAQYALASGVPFTTVAQKYSQHSSARNGGIVQLTRGRSEFRRIPGFEAFLFQLKFGEQTQAQPFGRAWVIAKCLDRKPAATEPFANVRLNCRLDTMLQLGARANGSKLNREFQAFRKSVPVHGATPELQVALKG